MTWVKLDDGFRHHPKAIRIGPLGRDLFVCGLGYCNEHLTDGLIPDDMVCHLAPGQSRPRKSVELLMAAGLWSRVEGGYLVHDYLEYNPSRTDILSHRAAQHEAKVAAGKKGGLRSAEQRASRREAPVLDSCLESAAPLLVSDPSRTQAPTRPDPITTTTTPPVVPPRGRTISPDFEQFWSRYPSKVGKAAALKAWQKLHLNGKAPEVLAGLERTRAYLTRDGGQYIPNPATWLNQGRWADEPRQDIAHVANPRNVAALQAWLNEDADGPRG